MLWRYNHAMPKDEEFLVLRHFQAALWVCEHLPRGIEVIRGRRRYWSLPTCHSLAHAYGKVFELPVIDGELAYIEKTTLIPHRNPRREKIDVECAFIKHSWINLELK